jgi:hypothetical protein
MQLAMSRSQLLPSFLQAPRGATTAGPCVVAEGGFK